MSKEKRAAAAAACNPSWLWACICVYLTPSLPSAPCIMIQRRGTCVRAWWLHNSRARFLWWRQRLDQHRHAATSIIQTPHSGRQSVSSAKFTCINRDGNADMLNTNGRHRHACRCTGIAPCESWSASDWSICRSQTPMFVWPPSAHRRSLGLKEFLLRMEKKQVYYHLDVMLIKHVLIFIFPSLHSTCQDNRYLWTRHIKYGGVKKNKRPNNCVL